MQHDFDPNFSSFIDENIIGGITASLINSFSCMGLDEGKIETISFGKSKLDYFYDDNLIVCMETTAEVKEKVVRKVAKNIHKSFAFKFVSFLKSNKIIDTNVFTSFKTKIFEILKYHRLLPKSKEIKV
ncbi:MAG: hypothetical protein ACW99Q_30205 [Candidatus Kariarchaeaceae archaeon]|jgi:hypothetical protein